MIYIFFEKKKKNQEFNFSIVLQVDTTALAMLSYTMDPDIIKGLDPSADHNCHQKVGSKVKTPS